MITGITAEYFLLVNCTISIPVNKVRNMSNHSIFRYDNFIGCFSADKIKMSVRK